MVCAGRYIIKIATKADYTIGYSKTRGEKMETIEGTYKREYWVRLSNFRMYANEPLSDGTPAGNPIEEMSQQEFEENYSSECIAYAMSDADGGEECGTLYMGQRISGPEAGQFFVESGQWDPTSWDAAIYCIVALIDFEASETSWGPA